MALILRTGGPGVRLGEMLVGAGVLSPRELEAARAHQRSTGMRLGSALIDLGLLEADDVARALARQHGVPAALSRHLRDRDRALTQYLSADLARNLHALPVALSRGAQGPNLVVCFRDPDPDIIAEVTRAAGMPVIPAVACERLLERELLHSYPQAAAVIKTPPLGSGLPAHGSAARAGDAAPATPRVTLQGVAVPAPPPEPTGAPRSSGAMPAVAPAARTSDAMPAVAPPRTSDAMPAVAPPRTSGAMPAVAPAARTSDAMPAVAPPRTSDAMPAVAPPRTSDAMPAVAPPRTSDAMPAVAPPRSSGAMPAVAPPRSSGAMPAVAPPAAPARPLDSAVPTAIDEERSESYDIDVDDDDHGFAALDKLTLVDLDDRRVSRDHSQNLQLPALQGRSSTIPPSSASSGTFRAVTADSVARVAAPPAPASTASGVPRVAAPSGGTADGVPRVAAPTATADGVARAPAPPPTADPRSATPSAAPAVSVPRVATPSSSDFPRVAAPAAPSTAERVPPLAAPASVPAAPPVGRFAPGTPAPTVGESGSRGAIPLPPVATPTASPAPAPAAPPPTTSTSTSTSVEGSALCTGPRDAVAERYLPHLISSWRVALVLAVEPGLISPRTGVGNALTAAQLEGATVSLAVPSLLRSVVENRRPHIGDAMDANGAPRDAWLKGLTTASARELAIAPVIVADRVVRLVVALGARLEIGAASGEVIRVARLMVDAYKRGTDPAR